MGVRIIEGNEAYPGGRTMAVLYCSTTMWAFGPVFDSVEQAEDFLKWLGSDPRHFPDSVLEQKHSEWFEARCDDEGELLVKEEPEDGQG